MCVWIVIDGHGSPDVIEMGDITNEDRGSAPSTTVEQGGLELPV